MCLDTSTESLKAFSFFVKYSLADTKENTNGFI